jgi:hypothetical protein
LTSFSAFWYKCALKRASKEDFLNDLSNTSLVIVGAELFKPDDGVFEVDGINPWTVTVTRAEAAGAEALPQVLAGTERATIVSQPFKAAAGNLVMSYVYKAAPKGTGTLTICNVATGKTVRMSKMMYAGKTSGGWTMTLQEAGVYIAATTFPLGSGGGEVKLSQWSLRSCGIARSSRIAVRRPGP